MLRHESAAFPERLVSFVHRLLPRQSEVIQKMPIIGKITQGGTLPAPLKNRVHQCKPVRP
jgi:hypothetical protein